MVWCLALVLSAAAVEPQAVVLVTRRTGLSVADSDALSRELSRQFVAQRVPLKMDADASRAAFNRLGLKDSAACDGKKRCIVELAHQLGTPWVISLSFARLGSDLSIGLELLRESTGAVVEKDALIVASGATPTAEQIEPFSRKLREVLGSTIAPVVDVPVVVAPPVEKPVKLTPEVPVNPPVVIVAPVAPKGHGASIGLGVGAAASVIAGVTLIIVGVTQHADLQPVQSGAELRSKYSASKAVELANGADTALGTGIGLGVLGLALGTGAVIAW